MLGKHNVRNEENSCNKCHAGSKTMTIGWGSRGSASGREIQQLGGGLGAKPPHLEGFGSYGYVCGSP